ncbi:MAG: hypothetical protein WKG07_30675 [Hymenobacter sp.]
MRFCLNCQPRLPLRGRAGHGTAARWLLAAVLAVGSGVLVGNNPFRP